MEQDLANLIQVGKSLKIFYGEGNLNNRVIEIRAIVDDNQVVIRQWSKKDWRYSVEDRHYFEIVHKMGCLTLSGKKGA